MFCGLPIIGKKQLLGIQQITRRRSMCAKTFIKLDGRMFRRTICCWPPRAAKATQKREASRQAIRSTIQADRQRGLLFPLANITGRKSQLLKMSQSLHNGRYTLLGALQCRLLAINSPRTLLIAPILVSRRIASDCLLSALNHNTQSCSIFRKLIQCQPNRLLTFPLERGAQ
jgi:hypothetical protein